MTEEPTGAPGMAPEPAPAAAPPAPAAAAGTWAAPPVESPGIAGFVYADVPNRFIALIIDGIVMIVVFVVIGIILAAVGLDAGINVANADLVATIVFALIGLVVGAGYFIYTWTRMRASVGMRVLGMQVGNAYDGKTLTTEQASKRWLALWGPSTLSATFGGVSNIGQLVSLVVFIYLIYLLYTTAKSPTKQGFHDKYANTVVVKSARGV